MLSADFYPAFTLVPSRDKMGDMQTFLPHSSFMLSARVLDRQRLGKQRVEAMQILQALAGGGGWAAHPATAMWRGHPGLLQLYLETCIREWLLRGYKSTLPWTGVLQGLSDEQVDAVQSGVIERIGAPPWLGMDAFHASHRSNLLRKFPEHYSQFDWDEPSDLPYIWPGAAN